MSPTEEVSGNSKKSGQVYSSVSLCIRYYTSISFHILFIWAQWSLEIEAVWKGWNTFIKCSYIQRVNELVLSWEVSWTDQFACLKHMSNWTPTQTTASIQFSFQMAGVHLGMPVISLVLNREQAADHTILGRWRQIYIKWAATSPNNRLTRETR